LETVPATTIVPDDVVLPFLCRVSQKKENPLYFLLESKPVGAN